MKPAAAFVFFVVHAPSPPPFTRRRQPLKGLVAGRLAYTIAHLHREKKNIAD